MALAVGGLAALGGTVTPATAATPVVKIPKTLYNAAAANPTAIFNVIAQGAKGISSTAVGSEISATQKAYPNGNAKGLKRKFATIPAGSAQLSGAQILALAGDSKISVITQDQPTASTGYSNSQTWPSSAKLTAYWNKAGSGLKAPTICCSSTRGSTPEALGLRRSIVLKGATLNFSTAAQTRIRPATASATARSSAGIAAGDGDKIRRRRPEREHRLARRARRPRAPARTSDVIAARRLDPTQNKAAVRHQGRELLGAWRASRRAVHVRPARPGRREALAQRHRRRHGGRQLRHGRRAERCALRARPTIRS